MMKKLMQVVISLTLIMGLLIGFVSLVSPAVAAPGVLYVSLITGCGGNTPCYTSVQEAVTAASSGDEIRIADGVYTSSDSTMVSLDKSLTLKGGYAGDFSSHDLSIYTSILDGELARRVISLDSSGLTVVLDGLHVFRGHNDSSSGGGVRDYTGDNTLTIQNCYIYQNVANLGGGGVSVGAGTDVTLTNNEIYSNTAEGNDGGGIAVAQNGTLLMTGNKVYGNLVDWDAAGGGIAIGSQRTAQLTFNQIYENQVGQNGGGVSVGSSTVITAIYNTIRDNEAGMQGTAHGGGVYLYQTAWAAFTRNTISNNEVAGRGGGISVNDAAQVVLSGNTLLNNQVTQYDGGGIYISQSPGIVLENNVVAQNSASYGGGVYVSSSANTQLTDMVIHDNRAADNGGGVYISGSNNVVVKQSRLYQNAVSDATPTVALGSGLSILSSTGIDVVNTIIADNTLAGGWGAGVVVRGSESDTATADLIHTTIARNTDNGVYADYATVGLLNTILVSHTVGAYGTANGTVGLDATLWGTGVWANLKDYEGMVITGTVNYTGTPDFLNPATGDYHIGTNSAALDEAMDFGTATDIDGETRPYGVKPDIGADELVYSLGLRKQAPATAQAGELITYTLTLTNSSSLTVTGIVITDVMPTGAAYISGGTLMAGDVVSWSVTELASDAVLSRQFAVTATDTIVNEHYGAICAEGAFATGVAVTTTVATQYYIYLPLVIRSAP